MNTQYWDKLRTPPATALKPIMGGRLKGKTDISPQWRFQVMTETFGPVGIGWKYTIDRLWLEPGAHDQSVAFAMVSLSTRQGDVWSEPIPGIGGSMFIEAEKNGLFTSDEAYKMAVTDALSVAMKALGVAADVYLGMMDGGGSKYQRFAPAGQGTPPPGTTGQAPPQHAEFTADHQRVKDALHRLFGDDKTAALNKVEEMTAFTGKDGKEVSGVRNYLILNGKRLGILADRLEKLAADKRAAPASAGCLNCGQAFNEFDECPSCGPF